MSARREQPQRRRPHRRRLRTFSSRETGVSAKALFHNPFFIKCKAGVFWKPSYKPLSMERARWDKVYLTAILRTHEPWPLSHSHFLVSLNTNLMKLKYHKKFSPSLSHPSSPTPCKISSRSTNCQIWRCGRASWEGPSRPRRSWESLTSSGRYSTRLMLSVPLSSDLPHFTILRIVTGSRSSGSDSQTAGRKE